MSGGYNPGYSVGYGPVTPRMKAKFIEFDSGTGIVDSTVVVPVGFPGKVLFLFGVGLTTSADQVVAGSTAFAFGMAGGPSDEGVVSTADANGLGTSQCQRRMDNTKVYTALSSVGVVIGAFEFVSFGATDLTLRVKTVFTVNRRIYGLVLGGDIIEDVGLVAQALPSSTGNFDVTGFGFDPDVVFAMHHSRDGALPNTQDRCRSAVGVGLSSSKQGFLGGDANDAETTSSTRSGSLQGAECITMIDTSGSPNWRVAFVTHITDGVRLNLLENDNDDFVIYLGIKGGDFDVKEFQTEDDLVTDIAITGLPSKPVAGLLMSPQFITEDAQDDAHDNNMWVIGAFSADPLILQGAQSFYSVDGVATTQVAIGQRGDSCYLSLNPPSFQKGAMEVQSIQATGLTMRMSDADPAGGMFGFMSTFGPAPDPPDGDPTLLSATAINPNRIDLAWTDNASNESGYWIERESPTGGGFSVIDAVGADVEAYSDLSVQDGLEYNYRVQAFNDDGLSGYSNEDDAITSLIAPTILTAVATGPNSINVGWNDLTANETGYQVERESPIAGGFALVHTTLADVVSWIDMTVLPSTQYNYRVRAVNAIAQSGYSPEADDTTPANGGPSGGKITSMNQITRISRLRG